MSIEPIFKIQYGVYIITSACESVKNGQVATVVFQLTNKPIKIAICLCKENFTHEIVSKSRKFGVSILEQETPMTLIGCFGFHCGRAFDKFEQVKTETGITGVPLVLDHTLVTLEVEVDQIVDVNTHTLFIGQLKAINERKQGVALTYEYYHAIKQGKSPKNAPTYFNPDAFKELS